MDDFPFLFKQVVRLRNNNIVAGFEGYFFDSRNESGEKMAVDKRHNNADGVGLLVSKIGRDRIGLISHLQGNSPDPLFRRFADAGVVIQRAGDC